jgi:hypothetical protein
VGWKNSFCTDYWEHSVAIRNYGNCFTPRTIPIYAWGDTIRGGAASSNFKSNALPNNVNTIII